MKLRSGKILGLLTGLNVRVLRSGKEILTHPVKRRPRKRVTFSSDTIFRQNVDKDYEAPLLSKDEQEALYVIRPDLDLRKRKRRKRRKRR